MPLVPLVPLFSKRFLFVQFLCSLPLAGVLFGMADSLMIFRENRRCVHDDFAGTKVIVVRS